MKTTEIETAPIPTASRAAREPAENPLRWVIAAAVEREGQAAVVCNVATVDIAKAKKWLRNAARDVGKTARITEAGAGDERTNLIVWTVPLIQRKRKAEDAPTS